MDSLLLSRLQFALNIGFHYLYPPISIGLGLILVLMEGMYLKTKNIKYKEMTSFWIKIFALTFALGVATGLVQTFGFGMNWARYSRFVGDVFGSALAAEGVFAFFLEAGFLGVLLFGWNRVKPAFHYFANICVCLGAHFSAVWIIIANSWMQTPAGYRIEETPIGKRAVMTNFWEMVFNPSSVDRLVHTLIACWITGAFFVISVSAYYFLKKQHEAISMSMMRLGLVVACISLTLQFFSGDSSARLVSRYQPAKFAAFEGVYETRPATPMTLIGWIDSKTEALYGLGIPGGLSFLTYRDFDTPVTGLDLIPRDEWPNVPLVFQSYHLMIWLFMLMVVLIGLAAWKYWRGTLSQSRKLLWALVFSVVLPHIAQQAGWISAEVGRQPWIVYGILKTSEGVSTNVHSGQIVGSISMFTAIYLLLFSLFLFLLHRKIKVGPEAIDEEDLTYRNPYE